MDLRIFSNKPNPQELANVLIAFSCLDLGIEIVKVIKFNIPKGVDPYFLDGEIIAVDPSSPELARMPIALFPLELLRELFEGDISMQYHGAAQASLKISRSLTTSDINLLTWDIERRNAINNGDEKGIGQEGIRYKRWKDNYGDFSDGHVSSLFTPATFKILNMLFSGNIL